MGDWSCHTWSRTVAGKCVAGVDSWALPASQSCSFRYYAMISSGAVAETAIRLFKSLHCLAVIFLHYIAIYARHCPFNRQPAVRNVRSLLSHLPKKRCGYLLFRQAIVLARVALQMAASWSCCTRWILVCVTFWACCIVRMRARLKLRVFHTSVVWPLFRGSYNHYFLLQSTI